MKHAIRAEMLAKRDSLPEDERKRLSEVISSNIVQRPAFMQANTIAVYLAKGSEVSMRRTIELAMAAGKTVLVPVTNQHLEMFQFTGFGNLHVGKFGILEPKDKIQGPAPEVVLVPGIAFGKCMHRIGYGKGFYDKYFKTVKTHRIGVCYDFQLLEKLPSHSQDEPMDEIITDRRIALPKP
ncbi:MAG: 5-formyltetrahydrofolate cyclo-ligase [Candidatus Micrarchaeota archaeon]